MEGGGAVGSRGGEWREGGAMGSRGGEWREGGKWAAGAVSEGVGDEHSRAGGRA